MSHTMGIRKKTGAGSRRRGKLYLQIKAANSEMRNICTTLDEDSRESILAAWRQMRTASCKLSEDLKQRLMETTEAARNRTPTFTPKTRIRIHSTRKEELPRLVVTKTVDRNATQLPITCDDNPTIVDEPMNDQTKTAASQVVFSVDDRLNMSLDKLCGMSEMKEDEKPTHKKHASRPRSEVQVPHQSRYTATRQPVQKNTRRFQYNNNRLRYNNRQVHSTRNNRYTREQQQDDYGEYGRPTSSAPFGTIIWDA